MTCSSFSPIFARRIAAIPVLAAWALIAAGAVSLPGCGHGSGSEVGKVEGVVTLDGKPLPKAQVEFLPKSGRPSLAETAEDGSYRLQYTVDQEGALVGSHTVKIHTAVTGRVDRRDELVPPRYHDKTELKAEVKPGSNTFNFDLTSK